MWYMAGRYGGSPPSEQVQIAVLLRTDVFRAARARTINATPGHAEWFEIVNSATARHLAYLPDLAELLKADRKSDEGVEWSLITPLLSSSHRGWGTSSLDRDADELLELSAHLKAYRGVDGIALLGHSTGCQDAVRYAERERGRNIAGERAPLLGVVLQAPVSDRECFFLDPEAAPLAQRRLDRCREAMKEDKDPEATVIDFMTEWDGAPLSAARWFSLTEKGGDDDYFSSDFSDAELSEKLWALGGDVGKTSALPTLIIASLREQYLPKEYDTAAHARRLADAINRQTRSTPPPRFGGGARRGRRKRESGVRARRRQRPSLSAATTLFEARRPRPRASSLTSFPPSV